MYVRANRWQRGECVSLSCSSMFSHFVGTGCKQHEEAVDKTGRHATNDWISINRTRVEHRPEPPFANVTSLLQSSVEKVLKGVLWTYHKVRDNLRTLWCLRDSLTVCDPVKFQADPIHSGQYQPDKQIRSLRVRPLSRQKSTRRSFGS
jgi:hypothetical protein